MRKKNKNIARDLLGDFLLRLAFPKNIYIEPTNDCLVNCSICPNKDTNNKIGYIDFNLFKRIISQIALFKDVESIILHKNGEPLMHPDFARMIRYTKVHLPSVKVSFSTNGLPINEKISREILQFPPDQIFISYGNLLNDSKKNKQQTKIVKTLSIKIRNFLKMRQKLRRSKPKVTLRFIDKNGDFRILDAKGTKWRKICDEIEIRPYHTWCGYLKRSYRIPKRRSPCLSLWTTLAVNWNGEVSVCSLDYSQEGIVGNIEKSSLKDIWEGKKLQLFRRKHLDNNYKNLKLCKNCTEWRHNLEFWTPRNLKKAEYTYAIQKRI